MNNSPVGTFNLVMVDMQGPAQPIITNVAQIGNTKIAFDATYSPAETGDADGTPLTGLKTQYLVEIASAQDPGPMSPADLLVFPNAKVSSWPLTDADAGTTKHYEADTMPDYVNTHWFYEWASD